MHVILQEFSVQHYVLVPGFHSFSYVSISNRDMPISKLEQMFEAETLSDREMFEVAMDSSTQEPALRRLKGSAVSKKRKEIKVRIWLQHTTPVIM